VVGGEKRTVDRQASAWVDNDGLIVGRSQVILAGNLGTTTVCSGRTSPDIDVTLARQPVGG